jgi:hypothetical protein
VRELAAVPQIAFPENYDLRVATDAAFREHGLTPIVAVEAAEMEAALRIGVAVVPAMVAALHPMLRATPLADPALSRTASIARRSDMAPAHAYAALHELIRGVADGLAARSPTASLITRVG